MIPKYSIKWEKVIHISDEKKPLYQYFAQKITDKKKRREHMFKKHGRKGKYVNKLENSI